jgi:hypothetical protein
MQTYESSASVLLLIWILLPVDPIFWNLLCFNCTVLIPYNEVCELLSVL